MKRILIIEDDENVAYMLSLWTPGAERTTVGTLKDAITHLACSNYDVVICDLTLPDATPEEVLAKVSLRRDGAALVVLTGSVERLPDNCDAAEHKINVSNADDLWRVIERAERFKQANRMESAVRAIEGWVSHRRALA